MKLKTTYLALAVLASMGLALGACGGSGGDDPATDMTKMEPTPEQQIAALQDEINALREQLDLKADDNLSESITDLQEEVASLKQQIQDAADAKARADEEEAAKALTATAKALKAAIMMGGEAIMIGGGRVVVEPKSIPAFDLDGEGAGTTESAALDLKAGDSPGSLGSWKGMDYAGMAGTGVAKTTGMTRVYSNPGATKSIAFVGEAGAAVHKLTDSAANDNKDIYTLGTDADDNIGGSKFPTTGTTTYTGTGRKFSGTYMGASGTYACSGDSCTAVYGTSGITLAGTWTFTPNAGAMLQMKDSQYLHFGWWVRKDKDGPTHAGALYGEMVPTDGTATLVTETVINKTALVGKATYMGKAAGKFAISDPLRPANDAAGHFTADSELMADFKATGSTLSGTIDNFRLNDGSDDAGWSVMLQKAMFDDDGDKFMTNATPAGDQTVWSIGGNKSAVSGKWEARMFDEKADDSNVPTSVVGSFMSSIGTTHEMVGAFGATKE